MFDNKLLANLRNARKICILTGAGVSAESGIPTFRDALAGLWFQYQPEQLASQEGFRKNPKLVWSWYKWRRDMVLLASPNPAHIAITKFEKIIPNFVLVTQNVDGLHQKSGSKNVIELHGNIHRVKCSKENLPIKIWREENSGEPPRCPNCNAYLRPDVVWFGENIPQKAFQEALDACTSSDIFFSIGTSGIVYPAANLPFLALEYGAKVLEINPAQTPLSQKATYYLQGSAGEILPELVHAAWVEIKRLI